MILVPGSIPKIILSSDWLIIFITFAGMKNKKKFAYTLLSILMKIVVVIIVFGFIYKQVFYKKDLENILHLFNSSIERSGNFLLLLLTLFLMAVNWGLEALKWKMLIGKIEKVTFFKSLSAVFSGVSVSIFTP